MRNITTHHTNAANSMLKIEADDRDPTNGNASHEYSVKPAPGVSSPTVKTPAQIYDEAKSFVVVRFQHGPIGEHGVNGVTNEVLLAIVADRLEGFQSGAFACEENRVALHHTYEALKALESRTRKRTERGVEGRNVP